MKTIDKVIPRFVLAISLTACSQVSVNSNATATEFVETALVYAKTALAETQSVQPTNTSISPPLPTFLITPSVSRSPEFVTPPRARLDYAMATAPKVYNYLPYIRETGPYGGQYSGCVNANDFSNAVYYSIEHPLDSVTSTFDSYFQKEKWAFTEATTVLVGSEIKVPEVSYDVYRILPGETPMFERLQIALRDESRFRGRDYIDVRLVLTHIETKGNLKYFDSYICEFNNRWLWMRLTK